MKILVTAAGWLGSTGEIAGAIGQMLVASGNSVDVRAAGQVESVAGYDAVVIGSAVRVGKLHADVLALIQRQRAALAQVPVACFVVCGILATPTDAHQQEAATYLAPLREALQPVSATVFAGASLRERTPWWTRLMLWWVGAPYGDFRDWNTIRAWAASLPAAFDGRRQANAG